MRRCPRDGIRATMHDNDVTIDGNGATVLCDGIRATMYDNHVTIDGNAATVGYSYATVYRATMTDTDVTIDGRTAMRR